jgi:hypothetical protein
MTTTTTPINRRFWIPENGFNTKVEFDNIKATLTELKKKNPQALSLKSNELKEYINSIHSVNLTDSDLLSILAFFDKNWACSLYPNNFVPKPTPSSPSSSSSANKVPIVQPVLSKRMNSSVLRSSSSSSIMEVDYYDGSSDEEEEQGGGGGDIPTPVRSIAHNHIPHYMTALSRDYLLNFSNKCMNNALSDNEIVEMYYCYIRAKMYKNSAKGLTYYLLSMPKNETMKRVKKELFSKITAGGTNGVTIVSMIGSPGEDDDQETKVDITQYVYWISWKR